MVEIKEMGGKNWRKCGKVL